MRNLNLAEVVCLRIPLSYRKEAQKDTFVKCLRLQNHFENFLILDTGMLESRAEVARAVPGKRRPRA